MRQTAEVHLQEVTHVTHVAVQVRDALGDYVKAYGMEFAMVDGPVVITKLFGEGKVKVSDVPNTQDDLARAVAGIREMLTKNPFGRKAVL